MNKKIILTMLLAIVTLAANATVPDSIQRNLEDYDYLTSFTEENYAAFSGYHGAWVSEEIRGAEETTEEAGCEGKSGHRESRLRIRHLVLQELRSVSPTTSTSGCCGWPKT